jgi:hypothetical protein
MSAFSADELRRLVQACRETSLDVGRDMLALTNYVTTHAGYLLGLEAEREALRTARALIGEIMRDEVNAIDECEKWLRAFDPKQIPNRGPL